MTPKELKAVLCACGADGQSDENDEHFTDCHWLLAQEVTSATRDAALEEAAREADAAQDAVWKAHGVKHRGPMNGAERIRTMKSRPAERLISEADARDALSRVEKIARNRQTENRAEDHAAWQTVKWAVAEVSQDLGVDLDAAPDCNGCAHCAACIEAYTEESR